MDGVTGKTLQVSACPRGLVHTFISFTLYSGSGHIFHRKVKVWKFNSLTGVQKIALTGSASQTEAKCTNTENSTCIGEVLQYILESVHIMRALKASCYFILAQIQRRFGSILRPTSYSYLRDGRPHVNIVTVKLLNNLENHQSLGV